MFFHCSSDAFLLLELRLKLWYQILSLFGFLEKEFLVKISTFCKIFDPKGFLVVRKGLAFQNNCCFLLNTVNILLY